MIRSRFARLGVVILAASMIAGMTGCRSQEKEVKETEEEHIIMDDVFAYTEGSVGVAAMILDRSSLFTDKNIQITVAVTNQGNKEIAYEQGTGVIPKAFHMELPDQVELVKREVEDMGVGERTVVAPGGTVTFTVSVTVSEPGDYRIPIELILEDGTSLTTSLAFSIG